MSKQQHMVSGTRGIGQLINERCMDSLLGRALRGSDALEACVASQAHRINPFAGAAQSGG